MHKQNIADFILYDINRSHVKNGFGVDAEVISDVVEGWNRRIYVTPSEGIRFSRTGKSDFSKFN